MFGTGLCRRLFFLGCAVFLFASNSSFAGFIYILNNNNNGTASGSVAVFDETTLLPLPGSPFPTVIPGLSGQAGQQMVINEAGTRLYIANSLIPNTVIVMDTATMLPIAGSPFSSGGVNSSGITLNPLAPEFYVTNQTSDTVSRMDQVTLAVLGAPVASGGMNPTRVLANPNGGLVYVFNANSVDLFAFDAALSSVMASTTFINFTPASMTINPAGTILYLYGFEALSMTSQVRAYDALTLAPLSSPLIGFDGLDVPQGITISSDGTRLYVLGRILAPPSNDIQILDPDPSSLAVLVGPVATGGTSAFTLALNPAETRLYVGETDTGMPPVSRVTFFDPATLAPLPGSPLLSGIFGPISFAFSPLLPPPANLRGSQKRNDFAIVYEFFNLLVWDATSENAAGYYVYRDGVKIATLGASSLQYADHDRPRGVSTLYSVTAFDSGGYETAPISTTIQ